jgi:hypothetical protein
VLKTQKLVTGDLTNVGSNAITNVTAIEFGSACPVIVSDNCGIQTMTFDPTSGSEFPVGTTPVTVTVTDVHGNTSTCSFDVTVNDTEDPVANCPTPNNPYDTDPGECSASLSFPAAPTDNCEVESVVYSVDMIPISFPYNFPVGTTTVNVLVTDIHDNTDECSFDVIVEDNEFPAVACTDVIVENDPSECSAIVNFCDDEEVMYMITGSANTASTLYTINPATGAVISTIGATGQNHFTGIGVNPITKVMYGFRNIGIQGYSGELYTIDPGTGAATLVGPCPIWSPDLAFSPSGVLYAWAEFSVSMGTDFLCTIDQNTGAVTMVGDPAIFTTKSGLAFTPSGDLYLKTNGILYELNPANGAVISTVPFAMNTTHNMLTFDQSGTAFTGERNAGFTLKTQNLVTGHLTNVGFECDYKCLRH